MENKTERFSFLEAINNIRFSKEQAPGAEQYKLWLAHYCGILRSRLVMPEGAVRAREAYPREQKQRALLIGLNMERYVINLELKIFQDWIHHGKT